jgi:UDP-N-acetylmuramyl pentapeptide phosphotransferase/UDP-N-acetylglucosamine-1-phosphate transferase
VHVTDVVLIFGMSLALAGLIVFTLPWHSRLTADHVQGIQKMHSHTAARVGGLPIYIALAAGWYVSRDQAHGAVLATALLAGLPAFCLGLLEDVTKSVGVALRFLATMASGVLAWHLTGIALTEVDIFWFDRLLQIQIVSVIFTAIAIAGVANAVNIIDGMNGLAALTSMIMLAGLAVVSWQVHDWALYSVAVFCMASIFGFFIFNWPLGKIFLGDGGAYILGFLIAWLSILLVEQNDTVSPFAPLLICIYPVTEVLFSMWRRWQRNSHPGHPDRHHFHSLFKRRYSRYLLKKRHHEDRRSHSLLQRNALTGMLVSGMNLWGLFCIVWVYDSTPLCLLCIFVYILFYVVMYHRMIRYRWSIYHKNN